MLNTTIFHNREAYVTPLQAEKCFVPWKTDRMTEFRVVGIFARRFVEGTPYWWAVWSTPYDQVGRDDHWQPVESFSDPESDLHTDAWLIFERLFPRNWGDVLLLPAPDYEDALAFPFAFYGHSPAPPRWRHSLAFTPLGPQ